MGVWNKRSFEFSSLLTGVCLVTESFAILPLAELLTFVWLWITAATGRLTFILKIESDCSFLDELFSIFLYFIIAFYLLI